MSARGAARQAQQRHTDRVELVRGLLGTSHLVGGGTSSTIGAPSSGAVALFHRVLGIRQLVQAVLLRRTDTPGAHTVGAAVDLAHAATMVPLLLAGRRWRGIAATQLVLALGLTVAEVLLVGRGGRRR
jgi:hypothetical protein